MRYWTDGTAGILDELIKNGFILDDKGLLVHQAIMYANNYDAVEWLLDHGISPNITFDNKTVLEWAEFNMKLRQKRIDDSESPDKFSAAVISAEKIKELIKER
jgi:hypothetical protein